MQLQPFDIEVVHKKGSNIPIGDALSRIYEPETYPEMFADMDVQVHTVKSLPISEDRVAKIRSETETNAQLQAVNGYILEGWPNERSTCSKDAQDYWNHRDELAVEDGIIVRGSKIVIPKSEQSDMINAVHMNHPGCQKSVDRARDILFWSGMTKQIKEHVLACPICVKYRAANSKEPLLPHDIPELPWQNVECDLFTFNDEQYRVDAFSHHIEIDHLPTISSKTVIRKLKVHFSRLDAPVEIKTDNARQFTSDEFAKFAAEWNFKHVTSSPTMANSNGLAESSVKIAKRILSKAKAANTDVYLALLEYRNTSLQSCNHSPSQLLNSRRLRSVLTNTKEQLTPN
ncbi:uncharacterized protein K02A2.6-like [Mercenaria mercenaria]|uniref:uncharacterized protein K02A2.6-like n=1 Tax=Mercenaria mercenaria TaxID=6596 RepID=UPI00234E4E37|nr:uncharacterized protein K02A2.6-like [Mercenaria mercenaria]